MMHSPIPDMRSPAALVGGLVYFGRMLDKIRLHQAGKLPPDYVSNLGGGFDERCVHFLRVSYHNLVDRVRQAPDATDEQLLDWALCCGRHPDEEEIEVWNEFMRKRGWKDEGSATLAKRKAAAGFEARGDIETFFQFIDADEGRF
jgi:gluconokinase